MAQQPGAPPPPYGGYYPMPVRRPTNTLAIVALVCGFAFAPAGVICGVIARRQIRQTGEEGDGLALAGIIIGGIQTAMFVVFFVIWAVFMVSIFGVVSHLPNPSDFPSPFSTDFPSPFPTS